MAAARIATPSQYRGASLAAIAKVNAKISQM
jgi:hypothetical protein